MSDVLTVVNMIPALSSGETHQDSEANLAVNPANPREMVGTTFTPSPNARSTNSPVFYSDDGGLTWALKDLIEGRPVRDQTVRFSSRGGNLYAGVLIGPGGISTINFDVLRTNDFTGLTTMTRLARRQNDDQPYVEATTVPAGPDAGKDRAYVGSNDHAPANIPATMDFSLDAAAAAATVTTVRLEGRVVSRDGFQTRPAVHPDGTVYAMFYALLTDGTFDVVIVRDDTWASGANPFTDLVDPGDGLQGLRIATGVVNPFLSSFLGQQRMGGDIAIAVDPRDSDTVYGCFGDSTGGTYTLYLRRSTDRGATWSGDLRAIPNATNPAVAVDERGRVGFLYQQVVGLDRAQRWHTVLELSDDGFATTTSRLLADTPADTPGKSFDPYLGDYLSMMAVGRTFYGIFTANNTPDHANFPQGVSYQRNADFPAHRLLGNDGKTPVEISIDPFFFSCRARTGRLVTSIADTGEFGEVCVGSFRDEPLTLENAGDETLRMTAITSSSPDFLVPQVISYPMELGPGDDVEVEIRFRPSSPGSTSAVITVVCDDEVGKHRIKVHGTAPTSRLSLIVHQNFGDVCVGGHSDQSLVLDNSGRCPLTITGMTSSNPDFRLPDVLSFPLVVAPGAALDVPVRFAPTRLGGATSTVTVTSDDPDSPHTVTLLGNAPGGKVAVTGSLCFGGVKACCRAERTLTIANVGPCPLHVTSVAFTRALPFWRLVNNPFPATLAPGASLGVVVRYKATERSPVAEQIVVVSDDPDRPTVTLDVMAYTVWCECKGERHRDGCGCSCGGSCGGCTACEGGADDCCTDEDDSHPPHSVL
jgi:hypothetical protein